MDDIFTLSGYRSAIPFVEPPAARYQELQRHPDKFASGQRAAEQLAAVQQSATINQAWQTLRHPLTRAEYLLFHFTVSISPASSIPCAILRS